MHSKKSRSVLLRPTERARTLGVNALLLLYSFFSRFPRTTIYLPPFPWTGKDSVFFLPFTVPSLSQDSDPPYSSFESAHPRSCVPHIKNIPVDRRDEAVFTVDRKRNISHSSRFANASKHFTVTGRLATAKKSQRKKRTFLLAKRPSDIFWPAISIPCLCIYLFILSLYCKEAHSIHIVGQQPKNSLSQSRLSGLFFTSSAWNWFRWPSESTFRLFVQ